MNNDLIIDENIINSPQNVSDMAPWQIADKFSWLLINPDMTRDKAIQEISDIYSKEFHKETDRIVSQLDKNKVARGKLTSKLQSINDELRTYMSNAQGKMDIYENILRLRADLDAVLPPKALESSNEYISEPNRWVERVVGQMGFLEKIKFQRNGGLKKYNKIIDAVHKAGLDFIPAIEDRDRLSGQIQQKQRIADINILDIQKKIAELDKQISIYTNAINRDRQKYSDKMNHDISLFLSVFHPDPRERKSLRKIPPFVNMQNLTEPVAFFQNIGMPANSVNQIATIMKRAGLKVVIGTDGQGVSDPSAYVLRATNDDNIELITPFYSPNVARENISAVLKHLASHGVVLVGAVHPATLSQIDPRQDALRSDSSDKIAAMIKNKLKNAISIDEFINKYTADNNQGQFLFRGHNFITSDKNSSYATPTWRPGRSGLAYATQDPFYAYGYSGGRNIDKMAGETIKPQALHTANGDIPVGFLTVYKRSNKNIMVDNTDLEYMDTRGRGAYKKIARSEHKFPETTVSPTLNPVVARYLVSGEKIVQIDDSDPEWQEIMNSFAPNLNITHRGQYGLDFIRRLDNIKRGMQDNDGQIQTYNLTQDQLGKIQLPVDRQFHSGIKQIKKVSAQMPQISDIMQHSVDIG